MYKSIKEHDLHEKDYPELCTTEDIKKIIDESNEPSYGSKLHRSQEEKEVFINHKIRTIKLHTFINLLKDENKEYSDKELGMMYKYIINYDISELNESGEMCIIFPKDDGTILEDQLNIRIIHYIFNYNGYNELAKVEVFKNENKIIIYRH
jgi:hypothetical protein